MSIAGRAVVRLGDPNIGHPIEDAFETYPSLNPGERAARTAVCAPPESEMLAGIVAIGLKLRRAFEPAGIAIGGPEQGDQAGSSSRRVEGESQQRF